MYGFTAKVGRASHQYHGGHGFEHEAVCQDSNFLVDTSLADIPYTIFDTSTCAVSFYAFCFSVLIKLVVFLTLMH